MLRSARSAHLEAQGRRHLDNRVISLHAVDVENFVAGGLMIYRTWSTIDGREAFFIGVVGDGAGSIEQESDAALTRAISEVERAGFTREMVVRSRLFARDTATRQGASDVRRAMLVGDLRGGSSSFSDAERLPKGSRCIMELTAIKPQSSGAKKAVREYDPPIAPPMFATFDGLVILSGNTDVSDTFEAQLDVIRGKVDSSLKAAGSSLDKAVAISAFMSRKVEYAKGSKQVKDKFSPAKCPIVFTTVEGYSSPEKLIEIEVTARL
jgi:enamine deaminase RidA (YjgF/YER057c/UK114 family)